MKISQGNVISIIGKRGSGKTLLTQSIVEKLAVSYPVFVFDMVHNWHKKKYRIFKTISIHEMPKNGIHVYQEFQNSQFAQFTQEFYSRVALLNDPARISYPFFMVFDEIYLHVTNSNLDSPDNEAFKRLIILARNYGVGLIFTAQRPAILSKTILTASDFIYSFKLHHALDVKALQDCFDAVELMGLQPFHYAIYNNLDSSIKFCNPIPLK
jgi:hypothetical protein